MGCDLTNYKFCPGSITGTIGTFGVAVPPGKSYYTKELDHARGRKTKTNVKHNHRDKDAISLADASHGNGSKLPHLAVNYHCG